MELQTRVHYNVSDQISKVELSLDQLKPYQYDASYRMLLGDHIIDKLNSWERNIRSRKADPFTIVVCGDFKRGKSSLINALLGEDICPTNVTTETVTLNRISYGAHSNDAVLSDGRRITLTDEELERDTLEELMEQVGERICRLEVTRPNPFLEDITIIDTPGLGDAEKDFSDDVAHALQQADAVIYVFSASYPLSMSEQLYLKTKILPQRYTSLFLVSNYSDLLGNQEDFDRMGMLMEERVSGLLSGQKPYMVSALDERCRQLAEQRPNERLQDVLAANFDAMRNDIRELIQAKKDLVIPDRMSRMLSMMAADIDDALDVVDSSLEMEKADIEKYIDKVQREKLAQSMAMEENRNKLSAAVLDMKNEALFWMNDVVQRLEEDTISLESFTSEELTRYYSLFCVDTLQEAMTACNDYHSEKLISVLDSISENLTGSVLKNRSAQRFNFRFSVNNRTWTKGDNLNFIGQELLGGSILSLITTGIGGIMRKRELSNNKAAIIAAIRDQYQTIMQSIEREANKAYESMASGAVVALQEYHSEKIAELEQHVEQSVRIAQQSVEKKEQIKAASENMRRLMASVQEFA